MQISMGTRGKQNDGNKCKLICVLNVEKETKAPSKDPAPDWNKSLPCSSQSSRNGKGLFPGFCIQATRIPGLFQTAGFPTMTTSNLRDHSSVRIPNSHTDLRR